MRARVRPGRCMRDRLAYVRRATNPRAYLLPAEADLAIPACDSKIPGKSYETPGWIEILQTWLGFQALLQFLQQQGARAVQARTNCAYRAGEQAGGIFVSDLFEVAEHHDLAV